jgi:L-threonylcarbamoyladenylate synthase
MGTRRRRVSVIYFISKLVKWDDLGMEMISNPTQDEIKKAAQALKDGHLVAFPTETVYGLGADATNKKAVSRVYSVKARPTDHPLIVHISSINQLSNWVVDVPEFAVRLAEEFWPGPMTLILRRSEMAKDFITGGQNTVGLRVPNHPIALEMLKNFEKQGGIGVVAPSANKFGAVSPTTFKAVYEELGARLSKADCILDGGQSEIGIESTIVQCTGLQPNILRPGAITFEMLADVVTSIVDSNLHKSEIRAPGLLKMHYSPKAKVILDGTAKPGEGFIAMANIKTPRGAIRLASPETLEEFAKVIYNGFRLGDQKGLSRIQVLSPEGRGLAVAIRDRLSKSAQGK